MTQSDWREIALNLADRVRRAEAERDAGRLLIAELSDAILALQCAMVGWDDNCEQQLHASIRATQVLAKVARSGSDRA